VVGALADLVAGLVVGRQSGQGLIQQFAVIIGVIGAGVARSLQHREWFTGVVAPRSQRMEPEPAFVGRGRVFFLRVRVNQGGVEVQNQQTLRR
jgi:uncharacterized membrane protein YeaQ/YmgE (transglycosylase-associated protein family)